MPGGLIHKSTVVGKSPEASAWLSERWLVQSSRFADSWAVAPGVKHWAHPPLRPLLSAVRSSAAHRPASPRSLGRAPEDATASPEGNVSWIREGHDSGLTWKTWISVFSSAKPQSAGWPSRTSRIPGNLQGGRSGPPSPGSGVFGPGHPSTFRERPAELRPSQGPSRRGQGEPWGWHRPPQAAAHRP